MGVMSTVQAPSRTGECMSEKNTAAKWEQIGRRLEQLHEYGLEARVGTSGGEWFVEVEGQGRIAGDDDLPGLNALEVLCIHLDQLCDKLPGWRQ